jgi:N-acetylglucosamine-6-phosphate deacetylase
MDRILLENAVLLDPEWEAPRPGSLLLEGERIAGILEPGGAAPDAERVDLRGQGVAPGFVDLHYHGSFIFGPDDQLHDAVAEGASMARHGTTSYLATTVALAADALGARVGALAEALDLVRPEGARPIGIHLEGPWINAGAAGAQPGPAIRPCDAAEARDVLDRAAGAVRMVTLAPEIEGADGLQALLAQRGVVASLGHSRATAAEAETAADRGAQHATHLFNAMGPIHHREPGLAGMVLADTRLTADLICDGAHVHPALVRTASRALGERLLLVTDRVDPPGGESPPSFGSGPLHDDGTAWRLPDGRLAASRLSLDRALHNAIAFAGLAPLAAIAAVTLRPAQLLGLDSELGTLRAGARADLAVLDPELGVAETWVGGRRVLP